MPSKEKFSEGSIPPIALGEKHVACVLLIDTSGSMNDKDAIGKVNAGIKTLIDQILADSLAAAVVDISLVEFNDEVKVVVPFSPVSKIEIPELKAFGCTSLNEAILVGLEQIRERKREYHDLGVPYWRPWMFLITDGYPSDTQKEEEAKAKLKEAMDNKRVLFFTVAADDADYKHLSTYPSTLSFKIDDNDFTEAFKWFSQSVIQSSTPVPGGTIELPEPPGEIIIRDVSS